MIIVKILMWMLMLACGREKIESETINKMKSLSWGRCYCRLVSVDPSF